MSENEEQKPEVQEKNIFEDLLGDFLNLERGLPATFLSMLKSPGSVIDSYFAHENKYVSPFRYTIFILAVTTLIGTLFIDYEVMMQRAAEMGSSSSVEEMDANFQAMEEETGLNITGFFTAMKDVSIAMITKFNQIVYIVVMAPLLAFTSRLFFKSKKPLLKHHYVMLLYALSTFAVFGLLATPLMFTNIPFGVLTFGMIGVQLFFVAFTQIKYLKLSGFDEYFMSLLSFFTGYILYFIATLLIQVIGGIILVIVRG